MIEIDILFKCINTFPKITSCGKDGLRAQHLLETLCGEGSTMSIDLLYTITLLVNLWMRGIFPMSLEDFVASEPLKLLLKPDGGI